MPLRLSNESPNLDSDAETTFIERFLFNGLYRYDASVAPEPDLLTKPCDASADGLTLTCTLRDAVFSNGTPLTADDVAFTYALARSHNCPYSLDFQNCLDTVLQSAKPLDPKTIQFQLMGPQPQPRFITAVLPRIWIDSKAVIEGAFQAFYAKAKALGRDRLQKAAEGADTALGKKTPECSRARSENERLVTEMGLELPPAGLFNIGPGGAFDDCRYANEIAFYLHLASDSLGASGTDAIAIAYPILPFNQHPVGTGAWTVDEAATKPGSRLVLKPNPHSFRAAPATPTIDFDVFATNRDAADALEAGQIDWLSLPSGAGGEIVHLVQHFPNVTFAQYPDPSGSESIDFNLRPGQIFADKNIRMALELCIDKPKLVDAATDGQGTPAYGALSSGGWPGNPDLPRPKRDVAAAIELIKASGWHAPASGNVFEKDGRKLHATIWVRRDRPDRQKFIQLIAIQAEDCGIDIATGLYDQPQSFKIYTWPLVPQGAKRPFDAVLAASFGAVDPDDFMSGFDSKEIVSSRNPQGADDTGYQNPRVDQLIREGRSTYDIDQRRPIYQEIEGLIAADEPLLVLWTHLQRVALRNGITSVDGPLKLDAPGWDWQLEKIVLPASSTGS